MSKKAQHEILSIGRVTSRTAEPPLLVALLEQSAVRRGAPRTKLQFSQCIFTVREEPEDV